MRSCERRGWGGPGFPLTPLLVTGLPGPSAHALLPRSLRSLLRRLLGRHLRREGADALEVVAEDGCGEQHGHLDPPHDTQELTLDVDEPALETAVGVLDDEPPAKRDAPCSRPSRYPLPQRQLRGRNTHDTVTTCLAFRKLGERNVAIGPHRCGYLARPKEPRVDRAPMPSGPLCIRPGVTLEAVTRSPVEGFLVGLALLIAGAHRRHRQWTPEVLRQVATEGLTFDKHDVVSEGLDVPLMLHRTEREVHPRTVERVRERFGSQIGIPAVDHDVFDDVPSFLRRDERRHEGLRAVRASRRERERLDHGGNVRPKADFVDGVV